MALRPDRIINDATIEHFMSATAERGGVVCLAVASPHAASGTAMDLAENTVAYAADASGQTPRGVLLNDVVNLDLTRQHANWHKDEVQVGGKVTVAPQCTVVTDWVYPGQTIIPGQRAYVADSGYFSNTDLTNDDGAVVHDRIVGTFVTGKNEDGFCRVRVNIQ